VVVVVDVVEVLPGAVSFTVVVFFSHAESSATAATRATRVRGVLLAVMDVSEHAARMGASGIVGRLQR